MSKTNELMDALIGKDEDVDDETARAVLAEYGVDGRQLVNEFILRLASELREKSTRLADLERERDEALAVRITDDLTGKWSDEARAAVSEIQSRFNIELHSSKFLSEWVKRCEGLESDLATAWQLIDCGATEPREFCLSPNPTCLTCRISDRERSELLACKGVHDLLERLRATEAENARITSRAAAIAEVLQATVKIVEDMRAENRLHGHITDASSAWLIRIKPTVDAIIAQASKEDGE